MVPECLMAPCCRAIKIRGHIPVQDNPPGLPVLRLPGLHSSSAPHWACSTCQTQQARQTLLNTHITLLTARTASSLRPLHREVEREVMVSTFFEGGVIIERDARVGGGVKCTPFVTLVSLERERRGQVKMKAVISSDAASVQAGCRN